jgi:hypothetical protein
MTDFHLIADWMLVADAWVVERGHFSISQKMTQLAFMSWQLANMEWMLSTRWQ